MKKKIAVVTGTRAEYGLLYPLIKGISEESEFDLSLIVTGSHLSDFHGMTVDHIRKDGLKISYLVQMVPEGDTEGDICKSISLGLVEFSKIFSKNSFNLIVVLGDRYELFSICIAAYIHKIPIAHISGGEITKGAIDDSIRHSITKLSAIHFPSIELYAKRIIQMGENPETVYTVGALGIDNIKNIQLMSKDELFEYTGVNFENNVVLMTYHPVTLDNYMDASEQINIIMEVLLMTDLRILMTMPNADAGSNEIYRVIQDYVNKFPEKFWLVKNLGQRGYLSAMKHSKLMMGNSSSGIVESASFKLPVVNIGDRQEGRLKPANVIDCSCTKEAISGAINKALSEEFNNSISGIINPYGDGNTANRIVQILKSINLKDKVKLLKKGFYDLMF